MKPSQNYRWRPYNRAIKCAIDQGMIGKVESILLEFRQQEDLQGYRAGLEMPLLQDVSIHHFDLIRFFTGADCKEIYCRSWRPFWSLFQGKPNTEAILQMTNGVTVTYNGSWAARGKETSWDGNFTITGEKGCLTLDADGKVYFYPHEKAETVVLDTSSQKGLEVAQPEMEYTEMEYDFHDKFAVLSVYGGAFLRKFNSVMTVALTASLVAILVAVCAIRGDVLAGLLGNFKVGVTGAALPWRQATPC